jgi:hypothetical protein
MSNRSDAAVYVDFVVEPRDYFRAGLELAKLRIILSVVVVLAFMIGISYFFTLIDEQTILLQTSPLFLGMPVVAVVGQLLRIHATTRKYISALGESKRRVGFMFQANSGGYDVVWGQSFSHVGWDDVEKVIEKGAYFFVYLNRIDVAAIPKRHFRSPSDISSLRSILEAQLGKRARMLKDKDSVSSLC